ncbi:DNA-binding transcriptional LysR family regulator [Pseudomonas sp. SORGH_AS199]|uniref:LysR family transcriptional regulator n=1 Tax=Pseudomonas sp. SORGH_AS_0199 TaxID=3041761 RepID=UPI00285D9827|nr:LysR family transcriptional regulator [Pseudomonas sp. SORGH_AS_0199]MDR6228476.1 DNA-binding transcriptional LysR family regulator [Pseudomonas sp. SORGH_AS_0199]
MDIKQLRFLIALDETRHFGQAAARCHVTQPTLSMRLRGLEDELGVELVRRGQRFEGFTEAGQRILAWARTLMAAHDGLYAEAQAFQGQLVGTLRVGLVPLASFDPMPLLQHLRLLHPKLHFQLQVLSTERILEAVASNRLELGISYLEHLDPARFDSLTLTETRMGLLYDERHFSFDQVALDWQAVAGLPLGLLTGAMHFRQSVDHGFRSLGLTPQPVLETDAVYLLLQGVNAGLCCAVVPLAGGFDRLTPHARLIPIDTARTLTPLGLLIRRTEPRLAVADACFQAVKALYAESDR